MYNGDNDKNSRERKAMYDYEEKDVESVVERIISELPPKTENDKIAIAIILGGQPGAGKSTLHQIAKNSCQNIVIINGDEFRKYHPHFKEIEEKYGENFPEYTNDFSSAVTEMLKSRLIHERRSAVVEGTLRTAEVPLKTCREFKEKGYKTILAIMAVKPEISYLSTILRYEKMIDAGMAARATSKRHHDMVVENLSENLKTIYNAKVFDQILVYNRDGQCLSNMSHKKPHEILRDILTGKWNESEIENFNDVYKETLNLKRKRHAADLPRFEAEYSEILRTIERGASLGGEYDI